MAGVKTGSGKEVAAVTANKKTTEQFQRQVQSLEMEEAYAMKLLDLNHRVIKVNFRRLRDRVGKIKSHLKPEDIATLRTQDVEGKLPEMYTTVKSNSAIKIAAAAKRLNLGGDQRPKTAHAGTRPGTSRIKKSASLTGVFKDAPEPSPLRRASVALSSSTLTPTTSGSLATVSGAGSSRGSSLLRMKRPQTAANPVQFRGRMQDQNTPDTPRNISARPKTAAPTLRAPTRQQSRLETPRTSRNRGRLDGVTKLEFSSHSSRSPHRVRRTTSTMSVESIGSSFGRNPYEERLERRKEAASIEKDEIEMRRKGFMENIDDFIKDSATDPPPESQETLLLASQILQSLQDSGVSLPTERAHSVGRRVRFGRASNNKDLWKGIKKIRYLRIPEDEIDLSGVSTLAIDQLKLWNTMHGALHKRTSFGVNQFVE